MGALKGDTPGNTYTKLAVVKDAANGDYVLIRDKGDGTDEYIPLWASLTSSEALVIKSALGVKTLTVNTTLNEVKAPTYVITGDPTAISHATHKAYVDKNRFKFEKFKGDTGQLTAAGVEFTLNEAPLNGSVQVIINGVYYLSNENQLDDTAPTDFWVSGSSIIVADKDHGGTINLKVHDEIGVYYQSH